MWQIITPGVEWLDIVLLQAVAACEGQKKASLLDKVYERLIDISIFI